MATNVELVNSVLIGDGANSAAASALTLGTLAKGDIVLAKADGTIIATNGAAAALTPQDKVFVVMGTGDGNNKKSSPLTGSTIKTVNFRKYAAPTTQVTYLGYDGANFATFPIANETEYQFNVMVKNSQAVHGQKQEFENYNITSGIAATTADVFFSFLKLFYTRENNGNRKKYRGRFVDLEVTNASTTTGTIGGGAVTATLIKNSQYVTFSGAHGLAIGDYLRFVGTGNTVGMYKVEKVLSTTQVKLSTQYVGASGSGISAVTVDISGNADEFALKITAQTPRIVARNEWEIVAFEASLHRADNFTPTSDVAEYVETEASFGSGYWKAVWDREFFAQGYEGVNSRNLEYDTSAGLNPPFYATEDVEYNSIIITGLATSYQDHQKTRTAPVMDEIYLPLVTDPPASGEQSNNSAEDFVHILNGYLNGVLGFDAITFA
jgi:hypothetical protein